METVNIHAAMTQFSRLVEAAAGGQEIIIARGGKPVAKLVPLSEPAVRPPRILGAMTGRLRIPEGFDAPLPDAVIDGFEGR